MKQQITAFSLSLLGAAALYGQPALTIYNQDFGVVRDNVSLELKEGISDVSYSGVTSRLEPESVVLRDPAGEVPLSIVEQSYRGDPVNQTRLLQLFEGQTIRFLVQNGDKETTVSGKIVRAPSNVTPEPIIEVDGELRTRLPGLPLFPSLGDGSILQPTLAWKIHSATQAKLDAQLSYVTRGLSWKADYNMILPEKGDELTLTGWISIENSTGKTFDEAKIKLIAGNVNKVQEYAKANYDMLARASVMAAAAPQVEEKKFDEFHMYTLPLSTTLRDQETKQVEFVSVPGVKTSRSYVYDGSNQRTFAYRNSVIQDPNFGINSDADVAIYREFKNTKDNGLGIPLPGGRTRFYRADSDGQLEFIGENTIAHTPKDETVRIYLGDAFDIIGERTRTDFFKHPTQDLIRETFKIQIRNRSDEDVTVQVTEHMLRWANWSITQSTYDFKKVNAQTIEFPIAVRAGETQTVSYTVMYTW